MTATIGVVGHMAITAGIAATGALREWDRDPQPLMLLLVEIGALGAGITLSPLGRRATALVAVLIAIGLRGRLKILAGTPISAHAKS